jgi:Fic family protein
MPPEYSDMQKLMDELLDFINNKKEVSPLIRA